MLAGVSRAAYYYEPVPETPLNLMLMEWIDKEYTKHPGSRRMTAVLQNEGYLVNRKRIARLMRQMGLEAIYPKRGISQANASEVSLSFKR